MITSQGVKDWVIIGAASQQIVAWRLCALGPAEEGNCGHAQ
jgi:hypothetical protein